MGVNGSPAGGVRHRLIAPRGPVRWFRAAAVVGAVFSLCVVAMAAVLASAAFEGREARTLARSGQMVTTADEPTMALLAAGWDAVGLDHVGVYYYAQVSADAPPPPGLTEWPAPGEIALSPALSSGDAAQMMQARFGPQSAVIGDAALASPRERLVFVFRALSDVDEADFIPISAWDGGGHAVGERLYDQPLGVFLVALLPFPLVGGIGLSLAAARLGDRVVGNGLRVLERIGASRVQRARALWACDRVAWVVGVVAALGVAAWTVSTDVILPIVGFTLLRADVRPHAPALVAALLIGALVAAAIIVIASGRRGRAGTRPGEARAQQRPHRIAATICTVLLATLIPVALLTTRFPQVRIVVGTVTLLATAAIIVTIPGLLGLALWKASARIAAWAQARGDAGLLIGARQLERHRGAAVRLGSVIAAATVLVVILASYAQSYGVDQELAHTAKNLRGHVAVASGGRSSLFALGDLPAGYAAVETWVEVPRDPADDLIVHASTDDSTLAELGLRVGDHLSQAVDRVDPTAMSLLESAGLTDVPLQQGPAPVGADVETFFFGAAGVPIDSDAIATVIAQANTPAPTVRTPGEEWLRGAIVAQDQARWISLFGLAGILLIFVAIFVNASAELVRAADEIAPLTTVGIKRNAIAQAVGVRLIPAVMIGLAVAVVASVVTAYPILPSVYGQHLPWPIILGTTAFAALGSLAVWSLVTSIVHRATNAWLPGQDTADELTD